MQSKQHRAIDKETRLLAAAGRVIHRQGFLRTTLSEIASEAEVPLGSLYYYFKTKTDILAAIIDERVRFLREKLDAWELIDDPRARLKALIRIWVDDREIDARFGCPVGSLCYELAKGRGALSDTASEPLRVLVDWAERQFRALGHTPAQARDLGLHLNIALQGVSLVANAYGDPTVITRETRRLCRWVDEL